MKRYIMDIEEKVYDLDLEKIITDSENTSEAKALVLKELKFTSSFDIGIVSDVIDQCWNEYWGDYVTYKKLYERNAGRFTSIPWLKFL